MMMTIAARDVSSRWLLIGSLGMNLFLVGMIGALATRSYFVTPRPTAAERPHTAAARIDRLAGKLGPADAEKLRTAFRTREAEAERARKALVRAVERLKTALRTQPFDKQQLRAAIAEVRTVRTVYEQEMQEI